MKLQVSDIGKVALILALAHYLANNRRWFSPPRPGLLGFDGGAWKAWRKGKSSFAGRLLACLWLPVWPLRFLRPPGYACKWKKILGSFHVPYPEHKDESSGDFLNGFVKPCLVIGGVCALIMKEPDLGTTVLCASVGGILLFHRRRAPPVCLATRRVGCDGFFHPRRRPGPNRSRACSRCSSIRKGRSRVSVTSFGRAWRGFAVGGVDGAGLGRGMQQESFLPEAHTDFVFAIVGEELGFFVTLGVAVAFLAIFWVVTANPRRQQDVFRFNVCLGATLFIVLQSLINMGVVTGLLPTKGMSLPFISYGGTNLLMMFTLVGLILNCMRTASRIPLGGARELP